MTGLNRSHVAVQEKLSNMTNLTFERAVKIAVNNFGQVNEHVRQFHSPGGATVGVSSSENVNRVRFVPKQSGDILDKSTDSKNRVNRLQDNNVGVMAASMRHRHASLNSKDVSNVAILRTQRSAMANQGAFCDRVSSVTEESPDKINTSWCTARTQWMY